VFIVNIDSGWDEWVDGKWRERGPSNQYVNQNGDHACQPKQP
jgi:hypothetical protein